jgi:hypothetical protein
MRFIIYCHTNKMSGKAYVGQTKRSMMQRWAQHVHDARTGHGCRALSAAIRKYGSDAFAHAAQRTPEQMSAAGKKAAESLTPEQRSEKQRKASLKMWARRSPEERNALVRAQQSKQSPEQRRARGLKAWAARGASGQAQEIRRASSIAQKAWAVRRMRHGTDAGRQAGLKSWETRRANAKKDVA